MEKFFVYFLGLASLTLSHSVHADAPLSANKRPKMVQDRTQIVPVEKDVFGVGFELTMVKSEDMSAETAEELIAEVCAEFSQLGELLYCDHTFNEDVYFFQRPYYKIQGVYNEKHDIYTVETLRLRENINELIDSHTGNEYAHFSGKVRKSSEPIGSVTVMEYAMVEQARPGAQPGTCARRFGTGVEDNPYARSGCAYPSAGPIVHRQK